MTVRLIALEVDARDPHALAAFWAPILRREITPDGTALTALAGHDFEIWFVPTSAAKTAPHRMHLDLTSSSPEDQRRTVDLALALAARHLDVGQRGDEGHVVLADPEGNEFCVIEAGSGFLAGTARIGALAGDGSRATGVFWSEALGWPLVWDEDGETAVQSPAGGTKLTWGGPPIAPKHGRNRLRWVLETDLALTAEVDRLVGLGARVLQTGPARAELADPDDNELVVITGPRR